ncbi:MAG TPA: STAS domain-containing protein [Jatrophihabitans sp.]|jgi:anti-anti-sigma factor|uniref:STAS domain-containing protein n=1 Tax=Jatrophihabitans sp. TaxID=1932789 RepID=UPI002DFA1479|nr:STAS domain-containing protein [Jatrophihabitans sp.]
MTEHGAPAADADQTFHVDERRDGTGAVQLIVVGEIDIATAATLRRALAELLRKSPGRLILDLGGVDFIDSSGLAVLLEAASGVEHIELVRPSLAVRRVIELSGLASVLPFRR